MIDIKIDDFVVMEHPYKPGSYAVAQVVSFTPSTVAVIYWDGTKGATNPSTPALRKRSYIFSVLPEGTSPQAMAAELATIEAMREDRIKAAVSDATTSIRSLGTEKE